MILVILVISFLLIGVVYFVFFFMSYKLVIDFESMSAYECGFDPNSLTRLTFSYRFFLISILFLIFDVEIAIMLPIPFLIKSLYGVWIFVFFIMILVVGLIYEYYCGSLDWLYFFISKA